MKISKYIFILLNYGVGYHRYSNIMVVTVNVSSFMSYLIINAADSVEGWVVGYC